MRRSSTPTQRRDLYAEVTQKLIAQIERDPGEPKLPWRRTGGRPLWMPVNAATQKPYRGINTLMLWATAEEKRFTTPIFATYKQWQALGAQVNGGEKSATVIKYGEYEVEPATDTEDDDGRRLYIKGYSVFNADQVSGYVLPERPVSRGPIERNARAAAFIANTGAVIRIGGERAFYAPSTDTIQMPDEGLFTGTDTMTRQESWHAVEAHESIHWTSHPSRLDRQLGKRFGDRQYAAEELIGEIGSAMVCAMLEITQDVRADHAQYLARWLELMRDDPRAIFTAAAAASRAVDYLVDLQPMGFFPELPDAAPPDETPATSPATDAPERTAAADQRVGRGRRARREPRP